jgi:hypothetical protein
MQHKKKRRVEGTRDEEVWKPETLIKDMRIQTLKTCTYQDPKHHIKHIHNIVIHIPDVIKNNNKYA